MGTIQNDAIIVTGYGEDIKKAHEKAMEIFNIPFDDYVSKDLVTPLIRHITNQDETFMVAPDGSKEGWDLSNEFDRRRQEFIQYLKKMPALDWVAVSYGEIGYRITQKG